MISSSNTGRRPRGSYGDALILSLAGFLSGIVTASLQIPFGRHGGFLGVVFGVVLTTFLWISATSRSLWRAACFTAVSTAAYWASLGITAETELHLPSATWSMGAAPTVSPVSLFIGGAVGSLLVLAAAAMLFARLSLSESLITALACSPSGGIAAVMGWLLGPSLGIAIWIALRAAHLTSPTDTLRGALGETSHLFSLWTVWQTGIGFVAGVLITRGNQPLGRRRSHEPFTRS